jgi:predicted esterase
MTSHKISRDNVHAGQPVLQSGPQPVSARLAAILLHGRGASAEDVLSLAQEFQTSDVSYLAPQAAGNSWYPYSFLASIAQNEPWLTSALAVVDSLVTTLEAEGVGADRIVILGFSQGACLSLEFAARNAQRYKAVVGLSGGLIGPPGTPRNYPTPTFRSSASASRATCSSEWERAWTNAFIQAWDTPSTWTK